jgi:hypothetical protein
LLKVHDGQGACDENRHPVEHREGDVNARFLDGFKIVTNDVEDPGSLNEGRREPLDSGKRHETEIARSPKAGHKAVVSGGDFATCRNECRERVSTWSDFFRSEEHGECVAKRRQSASQVGVIHLADINVEATERSRKRVACTVSIEPHRCRNLQE